MASVYEKRKAGALEAQLFHAESGLNAELRVEEAAWTASGLGKLAQLSAEDKDRVCHAVTEALTLEAPLPPTALTPSLDLAAFGAALKARESSGPAPAKAGDPAAALEQLSQASASLSLEDAAAAEEANAEDLDDDIFD